jgi:hypothetical protein
MIVKFDSYEKIPREEQDREVLLEGNKTSDCRLHSNKNCLTYLLTIIRKFLVRK